MAFRKGKRKLNKKSMPCNKPRRSPNPKKKKVVKACEGGKEKIIHFGATGFGHNYSAGARKSFRARHKCGQKKSKLTASYWACKSLWSAGGESRQPKKGQPRKGKRKYGSRRS